MPRPPVIARAVIALLLLLLPTLPAAGQGTSRAFPDPMGFDEMTALLAPIEPSGDQRRAIGAAHGRYLDAFAVLRDAEIEAYLDEFGSHPLDFREDREEIVRGVKQRRAILRRIAQHDERFFAEVEAVLSDEQAERLPRLVARRERQRLTTNVSALGWELPRLGRMELVPAIEAMEVSDETDRAIDPLVAGYERAITPLFRRVHDQRLDLPLAFHDRTYAGRRAFEERMEALRAEFELDTPEGRRAYGEAVAAAVREQPPAFPAAGEAVPELADIRRDLARLSRLDRQLLADLRAQLEPADAERLERRVWRRAWGPLRVPRDAAHERIVDRLAARDVPSDLRAAIEELRTGHVEARRPLVDRLIKAGEDAEFAGPDMRRFIFTSDGAAREATKETPIAEARDSIAALDRRTLQAYADLTGEPIDEPTKKRPALADGEHGGGIVRAGAPGEEGDGNGAWVGEIVVVSAEPIGVDATHFEASSAVVVTADIGGVFDGGDIEIGDAAGGSFEIGAGASGPRGWLPGPIEEPNVDRLAAALGLDESDRPVLEALHHDYTDAFGVLDEQILGPAREAGRRVAQPMFRIGNAEPPEPVDPAEAFDRVRGAMDAVRRIDGQFFDDVALALADAERRAVIDRFARARARARHGHLGRGAMFGPLSSGSREQRVDLVALVAGAPGLSAGDRAAAVVALAEYDLVATALSAERWDASLAAARREAERFRAAMRDAGQGQMIVMGGGQEASGPAARAAAANAGLRDLNRETLPVLTAALSDSGAVAIREVYDRTAFPTVFRDPSALERSTARALGLELSGGRRAQIEELCLEYRRAYASISRRMIDRIRDFDAAATGGGGGVMSEGAFERYQGLRRGLEADRFERRNLNERTRQALRDALGPAAAEQIGLVSQ